MSPMTLSFCCFNELNYIHSNYIHRSLVVEWLIKNKPLTQDRSKAATKVD